MIHLILHAHVPECLRVRVSTHTDTHTDTHAHYIQTLCVCMICIIERDTYEQYIYKYAHMHAAYERIRVRACPYLVFECGIGAKQQQLRYRIAIDRPFIVLTETKSR